MTWSAEHQAVLGAARRLQADGHEVTVGAVDGGARSDPDAVKPGTTLVSIGLLIFIVGVFKGL